MKTNLPRLKTAGVHVMPLASSNYSFTNLIFRLCLILLAAFFGLSAFAQNAIVGAGFAPGWGGDCGSNADFQYFSGSAGSSWIRTTKANGTGNQFFRLGVDWDGQRRQHTITIGSDEKVDPGTEYSLNSNCTTSGAMFIDVANADHNYVFKTFNAGTNPQYRMVYFRVEGDIRTITSVSVPGTVNAGNPATITATLSDNLAAGQGVYLRYTTDAFATSSVIGMSGAGNSFSANIPGFAQGTEVTYYCFTSGSGLAAQLNHNNADFFTINLNGNEGLNYKYTVQGPLGIATIAPGNWTNPATWEGGIVPNGPDALAVIRHNVTLNNSSQTVRTLTIEPSGTLNCGSQYLNLADKAVVNNSGNFNAGTGRMIFEGSGEVLGNSIVFYGVEVSGEVHFTTSVTINNALNILPGGSIVKSGQLTYSENGTLIIATENIYNSMGEWTPSESPANVIVDEMTTYILCNEAYDATFTAKKAITIYNTGVFIVDPLCNGNTAQPPGPNVSVDILTLQGGSFIIEEGGKFEVQTGDVGSLSIGTRFQVVVKGDLINLGELKLNDDIGDDLYVEKVWDNWGKFDPGSNASAGDNPLTKKDGRAVIFNGNTQQTLSGEPTDFHYLVVNNPQGILVETDFTVSRGLGLMNGKINLNEKSLLVGTVLGETDPDAPFILGKINGGSQNSYVYGGKLTRMISNKTQPSDDEEQIAPNLGQPYLFPVGTENEYRPFNITYAAYPMAPMEIGVAHFGGAGVVSGNKPNITDVDGVEIKEYFANAAWMVTAPVAEPSPTYFGTFNVSYTCNNCVVGLSNPDKIRGIRRASIDADWVAPGEIIPTTGSNVSPTVGRSGLTGFSQYAIGYNPIILPVRLKTFTGSRTASGNRLSWVSSSEINFSHYELQRSTDSRSWEQIVRINGSGGTFDKTYSHLDQKATGLNYYRLHMVDNDGSSRFSHIVTLKGSEQVAGTIVAAYQPGMQHIILQHNGGGFAAGTQARIADINGRILTQQVIGNTNIHYLQTGRLAAGVYMVQVQQGNEQETIKVWVH